MERAGRAGAASARTTVLAPILWGTTYVTITQVLPEGRPLLVAALRVVPAGIALLLVSRLRSPWRPHGAEWWHSAVLALCNFGSFFPLLAVAVYRLPGGVAAAAGGLQPLLVASLTLVITGRHPSRRELAVGVVAAVGVALVVVRPHADVDAVGVLAALAANVSFATGVVLTKRFPAPPNRLAATAWQLLLGGVLLVPLTLAIEGAPPALSTRNVAGFAYLSLVGTALAFVVWFNGIRRLPTAAPPLLGLASPITGATLGWLVLGQSLSPVQMFGFGITISAIVYGATVAATRRETPVAVAGCVDGPAHRHRRVLRRRRRTLLPHDLPRGSRAHGRARASRGLAARSLDGGVLALPRRRRLGIGR